MKSHFFSLLGTAGLALVSLAAMGCGGDEFNHDFKHGPGCFEQSPADDLTIESRPTIAWEGTVLTVTVERTMSRDLVEKNIRTGKDMQAFPETVTLSLLKAKDQQVKGHIFVDESIISQGNSKVVNIDVDPPTSMSFANELTKEEFMMNPTLFDVKVDYNFLSFEGCPFSVPEEACRHIFTMDVPPQN